MHLFDSFFKKLKHTSRRVVLALWTVATLGFSLALLICVVRAQSASAQLGMEKLQERQMYSILGIICLGIVFFLGFFAYCWLDYIDRHTDKRHKQILDSFAR